MTFTKKLLVIIFIFPFIYSCETNNPKNKLVGTWEVIEFIERSGEQISYNDMELFSPLIKFTDDGRLYSEILFGSKEEAFSYTLSGKDTLLLPPISEPYAIIYSFKENYLILKLDDGSELKLINKSKISEAIQPKDEEELIGKWKEINGFETIEFFKGGTVSIVDKSKSLAGDYRIIEVGRLRLDFGGIGANTGPRILTASINDDRLILTDTKGKTKKFTMVE